LFNPGVPGWADAGELCDLLPAQAPGAASSTRSEAEGFGYAPFAQHFQELAKFLAAGDGITFHRENSIAGVESDY
jgi:hypothetical protein